ncbi:flagellin [Epibacterium sp. DP7N7-1]|uniref:Flagellin n=1 Tax=Tritonibacter mobilis F1926 TaxID=1265309 RepID=A0A1B1A2L9_9RHOB|nr:MULTISPECIES: flagellin [Tritonibacter]EEW57174.1 flagellin domain protein [Ruegeria sp. TrichCH4B]MBW3242367.1 flagellin [Epibacterium sp. DP7N7-1]ANP40738.1 flagellin [Tritonibacter mobilis F1926]KJZ24926.1 flagellin [Tritonibacter mobilis]MBU3035615.1 flagellin [Tritonibacter mobilis]|eukprot:g20696.t1
MSSILTNHGAQIALRTLKTINGNLTDVQNSISTGKRIGSAKDNAAVWSIAKTMESDISGFRSIKDGLAMGEATVAVASAGAEQIVEKLTEIKELIVSAQSENVDHATIQTDIASKVEQVEAIIAAAQFNGANLLSADVDGSGATSLGVLASLNRVGSGGTVTANEITVASVNFDNTLDLASSLTAITDSTSAATALTEIEDFLQVAITGAASLGSSAARIEDQSDFVGRLMDSMELGVSALTDTNMEEASARLAALKTQQELAIQSLTIANQAPRLLLELFRR